MLNTLSLGQRQDVQTFLSSVELPTRLTADVKDFAVSLDELRKLPIPSSDWVDKCAVCVKNFTRAIAQGAFPIPSLDTISSLVKINHITLVGALNEAISDINPTGDYVRDKLKARLDAVYAVFSYWATTIFGIAEHALRLQYLSTTRYYDQRCTWTFTSYNQNIWQYFVGEILTMYAALTKTPANKQHEPVARSLAPELEAAAKADAAMAPKADAESMPENFTAKWAHELADSVVAKKEQEAVEKRIADLKVKIHDAAKDGKYYVPIFPAAGSTAIPGMICENTIKYFTARGFVVVEQSLQW